MQEIGISLFYSNLFVTKTFFTFAMKQTLNGTKSYINICNIHIYTEIWICGATGMLSTEALKYWNSFSRDHIYGGGTVSKP
jgi:hypothetical protein